MSSQASKTRGSQQLRIGSSMDAAPGKISRRTRSAGHRRSRRLTRRLTPEVLSLEHRRLLSTFDVTSTADDGSTGTLRWAIAQANAATSPSTIDFQLASTPATITLTQHQAGTGGLLELSNTTAAITIDGPGASELSISGDASDPVFVFQVDKGVTALISGLTITGGGGGGLYNQGSATLSECTISGNSATNNGSGLKNRGTATLTDCAIMGNSSAVGVGGLSNYGTATLATCTISGNLGGGFVNAGNAGTGSAYLSGCTISNNSSTSVGGGVSNSFGGSLTLSHCSISGNSAATGGGLNSYESATTLTDCTISGNSALNAGGLYGSGGLGSYQGKVTLTNCTISNNSAKYGGGLENSNNSTTVLTACTISGNSASQGGGLYNRIGSMMLTACTISGNSAGVGGGLWNYQGQNVTSTATLTDTIVAGNGGNSPSDIAGPGAGDVTGSYNLIGTGGSGGVSATDHNLLNVADPGLGSLTNHGGPTNTMALLPGSPAIGAGTAISGVTTDQRGDPLDSPPDIGAYQTQPSQLISLSFTGLTSPTVSYGTAGVTLSGTLANGNQVPPDTESVQVTLDGETQSAAIGTGGAFSTTFDTSGLGVTGSPYTIRYSYAGDGTYASANTTETLTVNRATPTVKVTDAGGTFTGNSFTGSATITGVGGTATASLEGVAPALTYYAGSSASGSPLGGAPSQGGTYTVVASFAGSTDYKPVESPAVTFTIEPTVASIALSSSTTSTVYGQSVTFVAHVTGAGAVPGGSVTFSDGGTMLGTVSLDGSGQASLTTANLPVGASAVTASYSGNADFAPASSGSVAMSVAQTGAQPAILPPQPVLKKNKVVSVGLSVQFGSTASAASPPSGMATFELITKVRGKTREKVLGTAPLVSGKASLSFKAQKVLNKTIEVVYKGDADYQPATVTLPRLTTQMLKSLARIASVFRIRSGSH